MLLRRAAPATAAAVALILAPSAPAAGSDAGYPPARYVLDPVGPADDAIFPEGIAVRGAKFFVGSTTDGTIYRGDLDERVARPFLLGRRDGRTQAIGMKVRGDRLFIAGGQTGRVFSYDLSTRELVGSWRVPGVAPTFLNDIAIGADGSVYVTDSVRPVLYRIPPGAQTTTGVAGLPIFLSFSGTALEYIDGFNVNGIVASPDGRYLILAQSGTEKLFRVRLLSRGVIEIDLAGAAVAGDGLVLNGQTLYAVERQGDVGYIVKIDLARGFASGSVVSRTTNRSFDDPTTAALVGRSLLVVNSQFGERAAGEAPGPFTVSRVPAP